VTPDDYRTQSDHEQHQEYEIAALSIDDIDVDELGKRIELATSVAGCDCNGGSCTNCAGNASCKPA